MNNHKQITALIKRTSGQANILTIPRMYIDLLGNDHLAALLLSQMVYWSDKTKRKDGAFYKTYADWTDELAMTQYQVTRATAKIQSLHPDLLERKVKRAHGVPTNHYWLDVDLLSSLIIKFLDNRETLQSDYEETSFSENKETSQSLTETTQKTTTKNKKSASRKRDARLDHPAIVAYRDEAHLTPPHAVRDAICEVTDADRWRKVVTDWIGSGWNPRNVSGMLDVYRNGARSNQRGTANERKNRITAAIEQLKAEGYE